MKKETLIRVNVSKGDVVDPLIADNESAMSDSIMKVLEMRVEHEVDNLAYFEVDFDPRQDTITAFCEVFDEAYDDIVSINLWAKTND